MATGLLAKKVGMTQVFTPEGDCIPVTVIEAGPCTVVRRKTAEKDGYEAVVLGFGPVDEKHSHRLTKAELGVFKKAGTPIFRHLKEVRVKDAKVLGELKAGDVLTVDKVFKLNQRIDVAGVTKGRGFAGVIRRWNFGGAPATHGHEQVHRKPGSIGQCAWPSKVFKGKKLPGQLGNKTATMLNIEIVDVRPEDNVVLVRGQVPGPKQGIVVLSKMK